MSGTIETCPSTGPPSERTRKGLTGALTTFCRILVAIFFLMAALTKILASEAFADRILLHSKLPLALGRSIVLVLPWLELTCGVCLLLRRAMREAALIVGLLLLLFLGYLAAHGGDTECGCLFLPGALRTADRWPWAVARNLLLLVACGWLVWHRDSDTQRVAGKP